MASLQKTEQLPEWDLSDLYISLEDNNLTKDRSTCLQLATEFKSTYAGKLGSQENIDSALLLKAITDYETLSEKLGKIISFAGLSYYKNCKDPAILAFYQDAQEFANDISADLVFFEIEINSLDEQALETALNSSQALDKYRPYLKRLRTFKPHQLNEEIEKILITKSLTSSAAFIRLYDETLARSSFEMGEKKYSLSEILELMSDPKPIVRSEAAHALGQGINAELHVLTFITNTLIKDKEKEDILRHFPAPASAQHLANGIDMEIVDTMVAQVVAAYPRLSHRYYRLKAKMLNLPSLNYWDRNAPLNSDDDKKFSWSEAREIVLQSYHQFSPALAEIGQRFFDHQWIDAPSTDGKISGAFSHSCVPSVHPYILMNYHGSRRDIMTLAHELGHGIHQTLAAKQGYFLSSTPLIFAETASVFGEMLTFQNLLNNCNSSQEKQILLASKLDDMMNTVVRQIAFYQFETLLHAARRKKELTPDAIRDLWIKTQSEALGPNVAINSDVVGHYWGYISHFIHSPFYVYAYAFGDCLVNSLYAQYQKTPDGFTQKYEALLAAGGSKNHTDLLAPFGLSVKDRQFWDGGLQFIEQLIDILESTIH